MAQAAAAGADAIYTTARSFLGDLPALYAIPLGIAATGLMLSVAMRAFR